MTTVEKLVEPLNKRGRDSKTFSMTMATLAAVVILGVAFLAAAVKIVEVHAANGQVVDWIGISVPLGAFLTAIGGVPAWYVSKTRAHETAVRTAAITASTQRAALSERDEKPAEPGAAT